MSPPDVHPPEASPPGGLDAHVRVQLGTLTLDAAVSVADGEVVAIVGPNGSGKTTLLRAMSGLVALSGGRVTLAGRTLEDPSAGVRVPPEQRPVGFVFQDYRLFPHLSALDNIAFGLRARGMSRAAARAGALTWLDRVGLAAYARARPREMSGGQAQRVALARALATQPALLLLDEPTAALDVQSRRELRRELRKHLVAFPGARLLVTHDPLEAASLADRLVVLEAGAVVQSGTPAEVSERPRSSYVAEMVGLNMHRGVAAGRQVRLDSGGTLVTGAPAEGQVLVSVQPRAIRLHRRLPDGQCLNVQEARVLRVDLEGSTVRVAVDGTMALVAELALGNAAELALTEGDRIWASIDTGGIAVY